MPYVEGFGTWPFGEEWLWEAIATSYLPLLDVLEEHPGRVTLSMTPVLCDQLEAPGALDRCLTFLRELRPESHRLDIEAEDDAAVAAVLEQSAADYAAAADALERRGDLIAAFAPHVTWTSAATHAVLPLLATSTGVRLQLLTGVRSHRERFGDWEGGLWLPECAHADWIDDLLEEAGARLTCVDWTDVLGPGTHAPVAEQGGRAARPARPRGDRSRVGARRLPVRRRLPRLAPVDRAQPPPVGGRRLALRRRTRGRAGRVRRRGLRRADRRPRRAVGGRARHRAARHALARGRRLAARRHPRVRAPRAAARAAARRTSTSRTRRRTSRRRAGATGATCAPGATRRPAAWRGCSGRPSCGR